MTGRVASAATAVRAGWGLGLLVAPSRVVRGMGGEPDGAARVVARVLAARHLMQSAVLARSRSPLLRRGGAAVDALHGLSMLGLAVVDRSRRRPALLDAGLATAFAVIGFAGTRS